jgi:PPOX class probable F420-dependent enzyme
MELPPSLVELIESGPLAHLTTINRDGSPQVSVIWIGLDDEGRIVSGHMGFYAKMKNVQRDPRVTLSFLSPRDHGAFLNPYAVLKARAEIIETDAAWPLLDRLTKVYMGPDETFPAPQGRGWILRYDVERVGGVGPWAG